MPFVITFLPLVGLELLAHPAVEAFLIGTAVLIGLTSLGREYRRHHHRPLPLILLMLGFVIIAVAKGWQRGLGEAMWMAGGGLTIAFAHFVNWRYCRMIPHQHEGLGHHHAH